MLRWFLFLVAISFGIAAALYVGWVILPQQTIETSPATLRMDYKTDYVLMVAEAYQADGDLDLALERLALLEGRTPQVTVAEALVFASRNRYTEADLATMQALSSVLNAPVQEEPAPVETPLP
jgi:hypothetical protein